VLEKLVFAVPVAILYAQGRVAASVLPFAAIDLVLGTLFFLSYRRLAAAQAA
jgi:hypothetical protein